MLKRTHLAVGFAVALYFLPHVKEKIFFVPIVLLASILPDIDSGFSTIGKHPASRPLQWLTSHRGLIHSFTIAAVISIAFAFIYPVVALPIFLGYSFHLLLDSYTPQGIRAFWPLKYKATGMVKTGGTVEKTIFGIMLIVDAALVLKLFI